MEAGPQAPGFPDVQAGPAQGQAASTAVELVLDSHRVVGEIRYTGVPRRLVDILNNIDLSFVVVYDGELSEPGRPDEEPRHFRVIHVQRNAILFAVPRTDPPARSSSFEAVVKVPVPAAIVFPGFEITGNIHLPPDADPALAPLLANSRFIPLTDATVVAGRGRDQTWREPIVVVNLARAEVYAPEGRQGT